MKLSPTTHGASPVAKAIMSAFPTSVPQAAPVVIHAEVNLPPLCRITDVLPVVPIKRSTVWLWVRTGRFPAPIRPFGKFCTVWRREDILAWLSKAGA